MKWITFDRGTVTAALLAGVTGQIAFEIYAWTLSPALFGVILEPARLVSAIAANVIDVTVPYGPAFIVHLLIGAIGFPLLLLLIRQSIGLRLLTAGVVTGLALWFIAQGILAPWVGRSFMMGFGAYTQSSLVGHVGMTMVIAAAFRAIERGSARQNAQ